MNLVCLVANHNDRDVTQLPAFVDLRVQAGYVVERVRTQKVEN